MILIVVALSVPVVLSLPWLLRQALALVVRHFDPLILLGTNASSKDLNLRCRVVRAFLEGLANGLTRSQAELREKIGALPPYERAFTVEGACAGLSLRKALTPWAGQERLETFREEFHTYEFLSVIGLGFAAGLSNIVRARRLAPATCISPSLRPLWFDGAGFAGTIFTWRFCQDIRKVPMVRANDAIEGFYEGIGRALWFLLPSAQSLSTLDLRLTKAQMKEIIVGYGIAAGFAGCTACQRAEEEAALVVPELRNHYEVGIVVGLFARFYTSREHLRELLERQGHPDIYLNIQAANELYIELERQGLGYGAWRGQIVDRLCAGPSAYSLFKIRTKGSFAVGVNS